MAYRLPQGLVNYFSDVKRMERAGIAGCPNDFSCSSHWVDPKELFHCDFSLGPHAHVRKNSVAITSGGFVAHYSQNGIANEGFTVAKFPFEYNFEIQIRSSLK